MSDKEKQIEEMAKIMCGNDCEECAKESANFYGQTVEEARNNKCLLKNCAKTLYNAGYRKIHDGALVIHKSEHDKLTLLAKECIEWRWKNCDMNTLQENIVVEVEE